LKRRRQGKYTENEKNIKMTMWIVKHEKIATNNVGNKVAGKK
jgi:hypothetical protein